MKIDSLCWSAETLPRGIEYLIDNSRLNRRAGRNEDARLHWDNQEDLSDWLQIAGARMGVEISPVTVRLSDIESLINSSGPSIVSVKPLEHYLLIVASRGGRVSILAPDLSIQSINRRALSEEVFFAFATDASEEVESILEMAGISGARREIAKRALAIELQSHEPRFAGWTVESSAGIGFLAHAKVQNFPRQVVLALSAYFASYVIVIAGWWLIGSQALDGQLDLGLLAGWALSLFTLIPLQAYGIWLRGELALGIGAQIKRILLSGALRMSLDETKRDGAGTLLGRVIESQVLEMLAVNGGFASVLSLLQISAALSVLWFGVASKVLIGTFVGIMTATGLLAFIHYKRHEKWIEQRLRITHDLVEKMIGYRTRMMQLPPDHWHVDDDQVLQDYYQESHELDSSHVALVLIPRAWILLAFVGISIATLFESVTITSVGIAIGGSLLAFQALQTFVDGLTNIVAASLAMQKTRSIIAASRLQAPFGDHILQAERGNTVSSTGPVVDMRNVSFSYSGRSNDAVSDVSLRINAGDKIEIVGKSGSGKSTLVGLLAGLYRPRNGLLLLDGMDFPTLGPSRWRRKIVLVPQFHDNYVVADTLAFNLFMGSDWPPTSQQLDEARSICEELGLRSLLERMPAGLMQLVGETGWRLSHGERSRIYVARALLQHPRVLIIDESFGTLDSENYNCVMRCVVNRSETLIIISHP